MSTTLEPAKESAGPSRPITPDELLAMPDGKGYELVDGMLVERHMGMLSSFIAIQVSSLLAAYGKTTGLAWVFDAECGYIGLGRANTVRKPDVSVVLRERLPADQLPRGWAPFAPDVAVEVTSPGDSVGEVETKVEEYLAAGVRLVWVVYPEIRVVQVHRQDGTEQRLREGDTLSGEDVLPGFACPVAELFPPVSPEPTEPPATESAS